LNVGKVLLLAKQTGPRWKNACGRIRSGTNYTKKLEMQPVTFVVSLYKLYAVGLILCSKIADVHGIEVDDVLTW